MIWARSSAWRSSSLCCAIEPCVWQRFTGMRGPRIGSLLQTSAIGSLFLVATLVACETGWAVAVGFAASGAVCKAGVDSASRMAAARMALIIEPRRSRRTCSPRRIADRRLRAKSHGPGVRELRRSCADLRRRPLRLDERRGGPGPRSGTVGGALHALQLLALFELVHRPLALGGAALHRQARAQHRLGAADDCVR